MKTIKSFLSLSLSIFLPISLSSLFLLGSCSHQSPRSKIQLWGQVARPSSGPGMSIGGYSNGCLKGGQSLYPSGKGHQVMRISRRRFYGHPDLIAFIEKLGKKVHRKKYADLLVGDLSQPRGGPMVGGHVSHQNGLDVDLWFWAPPPEKKSLDLDERENLSAQSLVDNSFPSLISKRWSAREMDILQWAAEDERTERIFVHPLIKKSLCEKFVSSVPMAASPQNIEWLKKIRPWWGHDDHFHVRLRCPSGSPSCEDQESLPTLGCDSTLDWWFSEEAKNIPTPFSAAKQKDRAKEEGPKLPLECEQVLHENESREIR